MATLLWFLKVDGVPGDSTRSGHKGEIDVRSFTWGASNPMIARAGGGAGGGKVKFSDMTVTTSIGSATPTLILKCAKGEHIKEVSLTAAQASTKGGSEVFSLVLTDCLITSVLHSDDPDGRMSETITIGYAKVRVSYTPVSSSGKPGTTVTTAWDVIANKAL